MVYSLWNALHLKVTYHGNPCLSAITSASTNPENVKNNNPVNIFSKPFLQCIQHIKDRIFTFTRLNWQITSLKSSSSIHMAFQPFVKRFSCSLSTNSNLFPQCPSRMQNLSHKTALKIGTAYSKWKNLMVDKTLKTKRH